MWFFARGFEGLGEGQQQPLRLLLHEKECILALLHDCLRCHQFFLPFSQENFSSSIMFFPFLGGGGGRD